MSYKLKVPEKDVIGVGKFKNQRGNTECVAFIQQATNAPSTAHWKRGIKVATAKLGEIGRGTVIATFDDDGKYPTDGLGMHAAIYLSQTPAAIQVLDQWNRQEEVKQRAIRFTVPTGTSRSNDGNAFYVVE
jgi:hypothetical protein